MDKKEFRESIPYDAMGDYSFWNSEQEDHIEKEEDKDMDG